MNGPGRVPSHVRSALKAFLVFGLVLVLQIPIFMINSLVRERQSRRDEAAGEIASSWGRAQSLVGPAVLVPYEHRWTEEDPKGAHIERSEWRSLTLLPESLTVGGRVRTELRRRGIFAVPVYRANLELSGTFVPPDWAKLGVDPARVDWSRAQFAIGLSDARAVQEQVALVWNGARADFEPGIESLDGASSGIHAALPATRLESRATFSLPLALQGTDSLYVTPFARETAIDLAGDWASPSFQGPWLPGERTVAADGFRARWHIPSLGRNYPQAWTSTEVHAREVGASKVGVTFLTPVDHYRMAGRSVKYAFLFLVLTFTTLWLLEVRSGVAVHPLQYALVGAAMCVFFLLELALSEHLGFALAYLLASAGVAALIGAYAMAALRSRARGALVGGGVAALYGFLFVLLSNEDYALLVGALGLFAALALVMFATRRVDWYAAGGDAPATGPG